MASILPKVKEFIEKPFDEKFLQSQGIIVKWLQSCPPEKQAIGYSGGKDSTAVLFLVKNIAEYLDVDFSKISIVFENTGIEYPETVKFVHMLRDKEGINLIELIPKKNFWQCVDVAGFPRGKNKRPVTDGGKTDICCWHLKEKPMMDFIKFNGIEVTYMGITALESRQRMIKASTHGTCYHAKKWQTNKVLPILYWSEAEVWDFIKRQNLPVNPIYPKGADRCGCMICTAHKGWKEQLQMLNPKMCAFILKKMQERGDERGFSETLDQWCPGNDIVKAHLKTLVVENGVK